MTAVEMFFFLSLPASPFKILQKGDSCRWSFATAFEVIGWEITMRKESRSVCVCAAKDLHLPNTFHIPTTHVNGYLFSHVRSDKCQQPSLSGVLNPFFLQDKHRTHEAFFPYPLSAPLKSPATAPGSSDFTINR